MSILVSVVTVSYNSEQTIARTIESVLEQTYRPLEYIIVDGASRDKTIELCEGYRPQFESTGISLTVVSEPDKGMYDALNKGTRLARGELVGQVNTDDWYEPEAVAEMVKLYEAEHYDLAWANIRVHKRTGDIVKKARIGYLWTTAGFCHPTMFSRRQILLKYPYACRALDDDFDMVTRAYRDGTKICTLNKVLANYTFGGMSTDKSLKKMSKRIRMKYDTYRRYGFSPLYWCYCVAMEAAKYILG